MHTAFTARSPTGSTQELIQSALLDLRLVQSRAIALSLFSENDLLSDIATRDLVYLLVPFVFSEVEGRVRTVGPEERLERAEHSRVRAASSHQLFQLT